MNHQFQRFDSIVPTLCLIRGIFRPSIQQIAAFVRNRLRATIAQNAARIAAKSAFSGPKGRPAVRDRAFSAFLRPHPPRGRGAGRGLAGSRDRDIGAPGERVARLEGFMEGIRDAIAGKAA